MRFGVLGPLAVWRDDGEPVAIPGAKVRALLADLIANEGRPVSTDRLVEDLWGDAQLANPAGALQVRVSQLRRALDDAEPGARDLVASRPPGYQLAVEPDALDARRFEALAAEAGTTEDPRARARLLADALALWRGPAFADFGDDEFARSVVTRLEEQRLAVLEAHAEARLDLGEHALLAGELGDLVASHPLRERLRAAHRAPCTGPGGRPRPSTATQTCATASPRSSASTRARPWSRCTARSWSSAPSSTPPRRRPGPAPTCRPRSASSSGATRRSPRSARSSAPPAWSP